MKIVLSGGGSAGHFTPLIAVARILRELAQEEKLVTLDLVFISDQPFDRNMLDMEEIRFVHLSAGKVRRYFSLKNIPDVFKTGVAVFRALWIMYNEFPDVVFSKGGFASFPILFAARVLGIPVLIHESDSTPGRVTAWAGTFAKRIAVSFPETLQYFSADKTAYTGNPIRSRVIGGNEEAALTLFNLEPHTPTILILGGSQGSQPINQIVLQVIDKLLESDQVIHQTGTAHYEDVLKQASVILEKNPHRGRYHLYGYLSEDQLRNASRVARLVISRAGANAIFEIAAWGIPSILIPLPHAAQNHQRHNAYLYARSGACQVLEESNLTATVFLHDVMKLLNDEEKRGHMQLAAQKFARLDAAEKIAREIIKLGLHTSE